MSLLEQTFHYVGHNVTWEIPDSVFQIYATACGARGQPNEARVAWHRRADEDKGRGAVDVRSSLVAVTS